MKEREALRLEKKMNEIERLQRDNLTSASLVNWQKWRAAEGKLRVAERDNDKLRQDLDTANRWIAHLEDEVSVRQCHTHRVAVCGSNGLNTEPTRQAKCTTR